MCVIYLKTNTYGIQTTDINKVNFSLKFFNHTTDISTQMIECL